MDLYAVALVGYRLMSNPVHLIAISHKAAGPAQAMKQSPARRKL